ncbi:MULTISPECIES: carbamoyltransferase family protein [Burkholderia]|uniref:Carbamoyltransferase n=1 Tax=Burkholderia mayonis TaxID=1385591 RepID=A0A1B4FLT7_9BURK|nr:MULTISPECIES: carbamoyltransferase C-terminal domain-containing protein [Burkholderia]AOJ04639.1 carbamoyltransferase [Burkholderia mayonis]KVE38697.1 carbamoyltransferase [Burkholderia sp. BDU5]KVE42095.1 carbamoyltransferase [Burkholderia mayonis]
MYILGINAAYHESAACLVKDGQVVMAIEEERLNRIKHGKLSTPETTGQLPWKAIRKCLDAAGIGLDACAHIGYSFSPDILQKGVASWRSANGGAHAWPLDKESYQTLEGGLNFAEGVLSSRRQLIEDAGFKGEFHFLPHHDCHAASAFHVSPFDKAAVLVIDGIGEWASTSLYHGDGATLTKVHDFLFPNSLGFVWEKLSKYLGFSQYDASKVMGLAAYGDGAKTIDLFSRIVTDKADMTVDLAVLRHESPDFTTLEALFGLPRRHEPVDFNTDNWQAYVDVAAGLQLLTEQVLLHILRKFDRTTYRHLCMAGGVALNCAANGVIVREKLFDDVFIQPASNDAGTAMGAAFLIWNQVLGNPREYVFNHAYLGPEYSDGEIETVLQRTNLAYRKVDIEKEVAKLIADGGIVGWFNGRMEWGPRALGGRSLLADPRNKAVRELMNVKVKHRELYRPFCPSILGERAEEWFEGSASVAAGKYMLTTSRVRAEKAEQIPAVVHFDGTVRAQTVYAEDNPRYHRLISEFDALTGVPLLLNTSFNDSEPIVCTPQDAINTFMKTDIDYLALGSYLISKR